MVQSTRQLRTRTPKASSNTSKKKVARGKTGGRSKKVKSAAKVKEEASNATKQKPSIGALQALLDMPLDVFLEICTHLQPKDLLNMARTSKELRKMFMDRNSQYSWKAARANVPGLPPCPDDLCEPAYAHLATGTFCHHCLRRNSGRTYWQWRIRLCKPCFDTLAVGVNTTDMCGLLSYDVVATLRTHQQHTRIDVLLPFVPVRHRYYSNCWYRPDVERLNKCVLEASPEDLPILLDNMERLAATRAEEASQLDKWLETVQSTRAVEIEKLYGARKHQILDKLKQLGWEEVIEYFDNDPRMEGHLSLSLLPESRKAYPLTEGAWKNMECKILKFMENSKKFMLSEERRAILAERFEDLNRVVKRIVARIPELTLSTLEVALHVPGLEKRLSTNLATNPEAFDIQKVQRFLEKAIPVYVKDRDDKTKEALATLVREHCNLRVDSPCDPLSLAVASLHICVTDTQVKRDTVLSLTRALRHQCPSACTTVHFLTQPEGLSETYYSVARQTLDKQIVWNPRNFASYHSASAYTIVATAKVVSLCGFDVKTATVEELDRADVHLCRRHTNRNYDGSRDQCQWVAIMPWRTAIFEMYKGGPHASSYDCPEYGKASAAQVAAAKALEPEARKEELSGREACNEFRCALCQFPSDVAARTNKAAVLAHIRESHNIAEPLEHHWVDEQLTIPILSPVYLVAEELRGKIKGTPYDQRYGTPTVLWQEFFDKGIATFSSAYQV